MTEKAEICIKHKGIFIYHKTKIGKWGATFGVATKHTSSIRFLDHKTKITGLLKK